MSGPICDIVADSYHTTVGQRATVIRSLSADKAVLHPNRTISRKGQALTEDFTRVSNENPERILVGSVVIVEKDSATVALDSSLVGFGRVVVTHRSTNNEASPIQGRDSNGGTKETSSLALMEVTPKEGIDPHWQTYQSRACDGSRNDRETLTYRTKR